MVTIQEVVEVDNMNVDSSGSNSNKNTEKNRKRRRQRKNNTKVSEVSTDRTNNKNDNGSAANVATKKSTSTSTNNNHTMISTTISSKNKKQKNTTGNTKTITKTNSNTNVNNNKKKQIEERKRKQQEKEEKDLVEEQRLVSALFKNGGHFIPSSLEKNNTVISMNESDNDDSDDNDSENESDTDSNEGSDNVNDDMFQIDKQGEEDNDSSDKDDKDDEEESDKEDMVNDDDDTDDDVTNQPTTTATATATTTTKVLPVVWVDDDDTIHNISLMDESNTRLRKLRTHQGEFDTTESDNNNNTTSTSISGNDLQQRLRKRYQQTQQLSYNTSWATISKEKMKDNVNDDDNEDDETEDDDDDETEDDDDDDDSVDNEDIFDTSTTNTSILPLQSNTLDVMRCVDANHTDVSRTNSVVQVVQFHKGTGTIDPYQPLVLTAGLDKTIRFFQIKSINGNGNTSSSNSNYAAKDTDISNDTNTNTDNIFDFDRPIAKSVVTSEKVQSMHFPKMPIYSANFVGTSSKVVISGRRPFIYIYDASVGKFTTIQKITGREEKSWEYSITPPSSSTSAGTNHNTTVALGGNDGYIVLIDIRSKHNTFASIKLNGSVRAMTYTPDGQYIVASGSDSDIYWYDIRSLSSNNNVRCIDRYTNYNDGSITSSIAISNNNTNNLAVGSESGVVNLYNHCYDTSTGTYNKPTNTTGSNSYQTPVKSIMNIKTSISTTKFNHDGQILAIASNRDVHNAMRLVHTQTKTVFSNWPTSKTPLNYIWDIDFSPLSKFIALGNDKGTCLLYQLNHYY